jgi:hypothetical protein
MAGVPAHHDRVVEALEVCVLEGCLAGRAVAGVSRRAMESQLEPSARRKLRCRRKRAVRGPVEHDDDLVDPLVDRLGQTLEGLSDRPDVRCARRSGVTALEEEEREAWGGIPELVMSRLDRLNDLRVDSGMGVVVHSGARDAAV